MHPLHGGHAVPATLFSLIDSNLMPISTFEGDDRLIAHHLHLPVGLRPSLVLGLFFAHRPLLCAKKTSPASAGIET